MAAGSAACLIESIGDEPVLGKSLRLGPRHGNHVRQAQLVRVVEVGFDIRQGEMPGGRVKAGILDHSAERRGGMMIDDGMQLYFGKAYLPKIVQKLRQIPLRLLLHPCNLHAVAQRRSFRSLNGKAQCAACGGRERGKT